MLKTIKRIINLLCIFTLLLCLTNCDFSNNYNYTVYVTATGSCYHEHSCRYIKRAKKVYSMSKSEAKSKGYRSCSVCKP